MGKIYLSSLIYKKADDKETDKYPFKLPFLKKDLLIEFNKPVTIIVGENGSGKSTLIEAIAHLYGLNAEGGSKNNLFSTANTLSSLHENCTLVRKYFPKDKYFYRAETFYNLITELDNLGISEDLFNKDLHDFSRGESFLELINNRFFGNGFYLLDEPETGLSFQSQLQALIRIHHLVENQNSQFIIATHSPIFLLYPNAEILQITIKDIQTVEAKRTKIFENWSLLLNDSSRFFYHLFN